MLNAYANWDSIGDSIKDKKRTKQISDHRTPSSFSRGLANRNNADNQQKRK